MNDVEQKIKDYISKEFLSERPEVVLENNSSLIKEGIIDSLGIFLLTGFIEEQFGIKIDEEDIVLENFETINAIKDLIMAKLSTKPPT